MEGEVDLFFLQTLMVTPMGGFHCFGKACMPFMSLLEERDKDEREWERRERGRTMVKAKGLVCSEMSIWKTNEVAAAVVMDMNLLMMRDWCWESHGHACGTAKQTVKDISFHILHN